MNGKTGFKRAYKACYGCRQRKVKCMLDENAAPGAPCERCKRENKTCVMPVGTKRGGIQNVLAGKARKRREEDIAKRLKKSQQKGGIWKQEEVYNGVDALNLLHTFAQQSASNQYPEKPPQSGSDWESLPEIQTVPLSESEPVKRKIISVEESKILVNYFMKNMLPFYPYIPREYQSAERISGMPLLLTVACCLAARYFEPVSQGDPSVSEQHRRVEMLLAERQLKVHVELWEVTQYLMGLSMLEEVTVKSVGTVLALLLLTEWNPTAVHTSKARQADDWLGLAASRRSDRLSWLLLGQAIRLSQDIGLTEATSSIYLALHTAEITLACRLGRRTMVPQFAHRPFPPGLEMNQFETANCELLQIMALANEVLYPSRNITRELVGSGRYIYLLKALMPHLRSWYMKHINLLEEYSNKTDFEVSTEDLRYSYHHTRLYVFSIALMPIDNTSSLQSFGFLHQSAEYMAYAVESAKEMLAITERIAATGKSRFLPIPWCMRFVHAVVFLIKSLLFCAPIYQKEDPRTTVDQIMGAAHVMIKAGPDKYHLLRHYGTVLMKLCEQLRAGVNGQETENSDPGQASIPTTGSPSPVSNPSVLTPGSGSHIDTSVAAAPPNTNAPFEFGDWTPSPTFVDPLMPQSSSNFQAGLDKNMTFGLDIDFFMNEDPLMNGLEIKDPYSSYMGPQPQ